MTVPTIPLVLVLGALALANAALLVPTSTAFYATSSGVAPFYDQHHQYHSQDSLGQYAYGYSGGQSAKTETKTADGITRGSYSYVDANGLLQTTEYTADALNGFRATATNLPKAPAGELRLAPLPVQETPEVAAARAEHLAAYEAAIQRNEQHAQRDLAAADETEEAEEQEELQQQKQGAIVKTAAMFQPAAAGAYLAAPAPAAQFAFAAPGSFAYNYGYNYAPAGLMYAPYLPAYTPAYAALRPAAYHHQYAYSSLPLQSGFAFKQFQPEQQPLVEQPEKQRPFVVTDTVAVRAEKLVQQVREDQQQQQSKKEEQ